MPLTDAALRALEPEVPRYSRTDERGLVIEVFPTGRMLWHYRYRANGKPERVMLGRNPALSLRQAGLERDRRESLVAQGHSPAAQKRLARQGLGPEVTDAEFGARFAGSSTATARTSPFRGATSTSRSCRRSAASRCAT